MQLDKSARGVLLACSSTLISATSLSAVRGLLAARAVDEKRRVASAVRGGGSHIVTVMRVIVVIVGSERDYAGVVEDVRN